MIKGNQFYYFLILFSSIVYCSFASDETTQKYTTRYDNIDIERVISNERLLKNYVNCLLDKGACTPDGLELKRNMPDAIKTECSKCSRKQKEGSEKIIQYLIDNRLDYWNPLQEKYDPTGSYREKYLKMKEENEYVTTTTEETTEYISYEKSIKEKKL